MRIAPNSQAFFHRSNALLLLLKQRGPALGYQSAAIKYLHSWGTTHSVQALPKTWHDKAPAAFEQVIPAELLKTLDDALALYQLGDDAALRPFVKERVCVELGTQSTNPLVGKLQWRSRKFSDPLFLTPAGFLPAYPENDEDLFLDMTQVKAALDFYQGVPHPKLKSTKASYNIIGSAVLGQIGGAGFKRWLAEVKNQNYTEPRRTLQESHAIYTASGRAGLKELYSPAYVCSLLRKFKAAGLSLQTDDAQALSDGPL